jgi:hypothetical protein
MENTNKERTQRRGNPLITEEASHDLDARAEEPPTDKQDS